MSAGDSISTSLVQAFFLLLEQKAKKCCCYIKIIIYLLGVEKIEEFFAMNEFIGNTVFHEWSLYGQILSSWSILKDKTQMKNFRNRGHLIMAS